MKENKEQGKQAEDESVFFWFGDDLAVDDETYGACSIHRKKSSTGELQSLLKVSVKKSPMGLFKMPEPIQAKDTSPE